MLKIHIKFEKFKKAFIALEAIYMKPIEEDRANIDATIQRFEFTFELAWKFLKHYFLDHDIELHYPKEVIQEAFKVNLIDNEEMWIKMLHDRNMTSHTYNQNIADEIYIRIRMYVPELRRLLERTHTPEY